MSPDVREREKPVRPRSRTPDERDAEVKRRKENIKREVSACWRSGGKGVWVVLVGGRAHLR